MTFPIESRWFVYASTGCSCCSGQNFLEGPYNTFATAEEVRLEHLRLGTLRSQYSPMGNYSTKEYRVEALPDGRVIFDDQVWGPEIEQRHD